MQVSVVAGSGEAGFGDGQGAQAHFNEPASVAVDGDGNIIVADIFNHRIRKISPDGNVSTLAGSGEAGFGDGQGAQAHFCSPGGVAVDGDGNIIVADMNNHRIRKIDAGLACPLPLGWPELPSVFVARMEALLDNEDLSDVTFVVGDTRIMANRAILIAQSEYFGAMLNSGFREGQGPRAKRARTSGGEAGTEITISDTTPEAFKALLRYLYTDELRFADQHLLDVMRKAKEISLERVYNHTVRRVRKILSVNNVVALLVKADAYGLEDVRTATLGFLTRNLRQVKAQVRILGHGLCSELYGWRMWSAADSLPTCLRPAKRWSCSPTSRSCMPKYSVKSFIHSSVTTGSWD